MEQISFYSAIKVQSPSNSIAAVPAIPALPAIPLSEVRWTEQMKYPSSSTYSQKMLHSIYYSCIPSLHIPKTYQKECSVSVNFKTDQLQVL